MPFFFPKFGIKFPFFTVVTQFQQVLLFWCFVVLRQLPGAADGGAAPSRD